jgi:four helix bundle protein
MGHHDEAKLDAKFIDFARQMNLYLNHFPKHEKYGLCQQIRNAAYEVYGYIVESQKRYQKKTSLTNLDICHEQLRMFLRLAFELGYFSFKDGAKVGEDHAKTATHRYLTISKMVDELGRMIGGWIVADRAKQNPDGGQNFVGFRTWCSTRFVRKHSLYTFTRSAKRGLLESVISIIGHAKNTASLRHLLTTLKANHHDLFNRLSPRCRFSHHPHPAPA